MRRDNLSSEEADNLIEEARNEILSGVDPE